jgi:hypothetical protein
MRAVLYLTVFIGLLWTVDAYSLNGRVTAASKNVASRLYQRTEYEIWKLKFYYTR